MKNGFKTTRNRPQKALKPPDLQIAKATQENPAHAGIEGRFGDRYFSSLLGAALYLRSRDDVDPERIGLWGGSYGGFLTALGLARASTLFAEGVDFQGAHDWNAFQQSCSQDYNPLTRPNEADRAFEASPMAYLDDWRSPVLLIHGDDDRTVPLSETITLTGALREGGWKSKRWSFQMRHTSSRLTAGGSKPAMQLWASSIAS